MFKMTGPNQIFTSEKMDVERFPFWAVEEDVFLREGVLKSALNLLPFFGDQASVNPDLIKVGFWNRFLMSFLSSGSFDFSSSNPAYIILKNNYAPRNESFPFCPPDVICYDVNPESRRVILLPEDLREESLRRAIAHETSHWVHETNYSSHFNGVSPNQEHPSDEDLWGPDTPYSGKGLRVLLVAKLGELIGLGRENELGRGSTPTIKDLLELNASEERTYLRKVYCELFGPGGGV